MNDSESASIRVECLRLVTALYPSRDPEKHLALAHQWAAWALWGKMPVPKEEGERDGPAT